MSEENQHEYNVSRETFGTRRGARKRADKRPSVIVPSGRCSANWLCKTLKPGWVFDYVPCFNGITGDMRPFRFHRCGCVDKTDSYQFENPS